MPWNPKHGRRILDELLEEGEMLEEAERLQGMTSEQRDEELGDDGITSARAAELFARAVEQADARASEPADLHEPTLEDELEHLIYEAWVRRIGAMTPVQIRELAAGNSLTDQQVELILRGAKARIEDMELRKDLH